jgi:hypothetical protein
MKTRVNFDVKVAKFEEIPNGVRWEAVIFSSEWNRNHYFFDIQKLLRWSKKLEKVLMNNDHDGKYLPYATDGIKEIRVETDDNGVTECFAVIESTNEEKRKNPMSVTGFSIELGYNDEDVIKNKNGMYLIDYEWVGIAYLNGILAGSGDTRILNTLTFSENNNNIMSEEQIKALLEAQKAELKADFEKETELKIAEFKKTIIAENGGQSKSTYTWTGEDGKTYTRDYESINKEIVSVLENDTAEEPSMLGYMAAKFGYVKKEENPELNKIEENLNKTVEFQNKMKSLSSEELNEEGKNPATVDTTAKFKFLSKFK